MLHQVLDGVKVTKFSKNEYGFYVTNWFDEEDQADPDVFNICIADWYGWKPIKGRRHKGRKWNSINNLVLNRRYFRKVRKELE